MPPDTSALRRGKLELATACPDEEWATTSGGRLCGGKALAPRDVRQGKRSMPVQAAIDPSVGGPGQGQREEAAEAAKEQDAPHESQSYCNKDTTGAPSRRSRPPRNFNSITKA